MQHLTDPSILHMTTDPSICHYVMEKKEKEKDKHRNPQNWP